MGGEGGGGAGATGGIGGSSGNGGAGRGGSSTGGVGGEPDPCDGVTCSGHGECVVENDAPRCDCDDGYDGRGATRCVDVDECATDNGGCDPLTLCTNTPGSRVCGDCPSGYTGNGDDGCVPRACSGPPDTTCPCIRVAPDGDDAAALADHATTPFRNVGPALDYADAHRNQATNVCVAAGSDCTARASYPGPDGVDLAMKNGISMYGSYESNAWTQCSDVSTTLLPSTPAGVRFGPDVTTPTALEGFVIQRLDAETASGATVDGARGARLSRLQIRGAPAAVNVVGVDVRGGASASLSEVTIPSLLPSGPAASGVAVGVRVNGSAVDIEDSDVGASHGENGPAYGIWLENALAPRIVDTIVRVPGSGLTLGQTGLSATGIRIVGGEALSIEGGRIEFGGHDAPEHYGIDATDAARLSVTGTTLVAPGTAGQAIGIRAVRTPLSLRNGQVTISVEDGNVAGVVLTGPMGSAPSTIDGIGIDVEGTGEVTGVSLGDCGATTLGASVVASGIASGTAVVTGVSASGDCQPHIGGYVRSEGTDSVRMVGVLCSAPSACSLGEARISTENSRTRLGNNALTIGLWCQDGCSEIVDSAIGGPTQESSACFRSCGNTSYGILLDGGSPLIARNGVGAGCADLGAAIRANGASSRIENNLLSGIRCSNTMTDNYIASAGIVAAGAVDVHSNVIDGGGSVYANGTCTSAAVMGAHGLYRNNVFVSGECPVHYDFSGATYGFQAGFGFPNALQNNLFDPAASLLYAMSPIGDLGSIDTVNAIEFAEGHGANLSTAPGFVAYPSDLHLLSSSACIDAGTTLGAPPDDLDGQARSATLPDIGAYEWGDR